MSKTNPSDPAKAVYDLLAVQYKPLEAKLLSGLSPENTKKYIAMSYTKKIIVLDKFAEYLGL